MPPRKRLLASSAASGGEAGRGPGPAGLTRRALFAMLGAVAASAARSGRAQGKASQQEAAYRPTPEGMYSCALCSQFRPPRGCEIVAGDISPQGWCKFFELPD